ncbi:hypothetical protein PR048_019619 [Dryococelus australis]|uniref:2-aminoethanethiol dioxygenase n=1 Tax=Dryococelus australis TaxID=614101 RepID=A0ABQ9H3Z3_9NEOP|nr:hypothetical protein PR048_019619 [Dryococelus australis]
MTMDSGKFSMQKLLKQTLITFSSNYSGNVRGQKFVENFSKLKSLADRLTAEHVNLDANLSKLSPERSRCSTRNPPVTYVEVYEDSNVTIGIFILKSGARLPLHDHPQMHGILKVLRGTVRIQSYSIKNDCESASNTFGRTLPGADMLVAEKHCEVSVDSSSAACVLTPVERNLHEIHTENGLAAFLDILSPPYNSESTDTCDRSCHYYMEVLQSGVETGSQNVKLRRVTPPPDFWNDSAPYNGPLLQ